MKLIDLFIIAIGLSMDAFAVAICKGLVTAKGKRKRMALISAAFFGFFQALMPTIGFFLGQRFEKYIVHIDHWIAFILLSLIGINMIREAGSEEGLLADFSIKEMVILGIATSIDAFVVGITFAFLKVNWIFSVLSIGIITFILSFIGVYLGSQLGEKMQSYAQKVGGILLILMGLKILLEHLEILKIF